MVDSLPDSHPVWIDGVGMRTLGELRRELREDDPDDEPDEREATLRYWERRVTENLLEEGWLPGDTPPDRRE